ncbi:MAG: c-type cytochrome [Anaerolineae bacterium]
MMREGTLYVILMSLLTLTACGNSGSESLPQGNAQRGEALFVESINTTPSCSSCHALTEQSILGPGLAGYQHVAGERVEGLSADAYTYQAIVRPASHLVEGYGNLMYTEYGSRLSDQELADLIAYLLTL